MHGRMTAARLDYLACAGGERQFLERADGEPIDPAGIVAGPKISAQERAVEIDQHVMVFAAFGFIEHNALEDRGDGTRFDAQPRFFPDFTDEGLFQTLPGLDQTTRQAPFPGQWWTAALDQQNATLIEEESAYPEEWVGWITTGCHLLIYIAGRRRRGLRPSPLGRSF